MNENKKRKALPARLEVLLTAAETIICTVLRTKSDKSSANLANQSNLFRPPIGTLPIGGCFKLPDEYRCKITFYEDQFKTTLLQPP